MTPLLAIAARAAFLLHRDHRDRRVVVQPDGRAASEARPWPAQMVCLLHYTPSGLNVWVFRGTAGPVRYLVGSFGGVWA